MKTVLKFEGEVDSYGDLSKIILDCVQVLDTKLPFNIIKKEFTPSIGDKFYFLPGVNIPRVKLKDFTVEYNVKVVRNVEDATVIFGSNLSNNKVLSRVWRSTISTETFTDCFNGLVEQGKLDEQVVERTKTALEFYTEPFIISDYRSIAMMGDDNLYTNLIVTPVHAFNNSRNNEYVNEVDEDYIDLVKFVGNTEVLDESCLLNIINGEDAVLVNKEVYAQLDTMFSSSDSDNHIVAMEILANCRYKESLFYIIKLMKNYYRIMRESKTVAHVNFKSLLSYIGIDKYGMHFDTDGQINKLLEKGVLTPGMLTSIIQDDLMDTGYFHSNCVQIKSLTVNDEIAKFFNKNYTFELMPDFEPVPETKPEPVKQPQTNQTTWL